MNSNHNTRTCYCFAVDTLVNDFSWFWNETSLARSVLVSVKRKCLLSFEADSSLCCRHAIWSQNILKYCIQKKHEPVVGLWSYILKKSKKIHVRIVQVSRFYKNNHFICEWNVVVYTVAVVSSCCRQHSYAKMIITFMLLNKKVLSGRRSFSHRVKYKGFATRSVCFGLLNTCISGVLECRIRS